MSVFDSRLVQAHRKAVALGMQELEKLAAARVRKGANCHTQNFEPTGNIVYAEYHHDNSRLLDPQLHTHNVVVNVTRTGDGTFKALETLAMCRAIRYAGKVYQNALASECRRLGYAIENKVDDKGKIIGFELAGVPDEVMTKCSRRRAQIEERIKAFEADKGRKPSYEEVKQMTLDTRSAKLLNRTDEQVVEYKMSLFTEEEKEKFNKLAKRARINTSFVSPPAELVAVRQVVNVMEQLYEQQGVIQQDKILAECLNQNLGKTTLPVLLNAIKKVPELVNLGGSEANPYYSTAENIELEKYVCETIDNEAGTLKSLQSDFVPFADSNDGFDHGAQAEVISGVLDSSDRFVIFRGVAGAGKTSTLQELCKGLKQGGIENIHVIAPTNSAVDVLRQEKFQSSETAAKFLLPDTPKPPRGAYLIVDETGLSSLRVGAQILQSAIENDYRVLFVGDERQHKSVEFGDFMRLIGEYSKIKSFALTDIHRQRNIEYRTGVFRCATGDFTGAFEHFDQSGYIHESQGKYLEKAADSFLEFTDDGTRPLACIAAAPTHAEGDALTDAIRGKLREKGRLGSEEKPVATFQSWNWTKQELRDPKKYAPGQMVFFNQRRRGVAEAGEMCEVSAVRDDWAIFTNGRRLYIPDADSFVNVGAKKEIMLARGDIVRFGVNTKLADGTRIINGSLAVVGDRPDTFILFDKDRNLGKTVFLPENFAGYRYGWVMTSHSSQGMTAENVVVAAQKMNKDAFYVSLSRGKYRMALHVPDKEFFRTQLEKSHTERVAALDLAKSREIPCLPTPEEVRARVLPDRSYLSVGGRMKSLFRHAMKLVHGVQRLLKRNKIKQDRERIITLATEVLHGTRRTHTTVGFAEQRRNGRTPER